MATYQDLFAANVKREEQHDSAGLNRAGDPYDATIPRDGGDDATYQRYRRDQGLPYDVPDERTEDNTYQEYADD